MSLEPRVAVCDRVGGLSQGGLGDVDRGEAGQLAGRGERVEQQPGLLAGAAVELDQGVRAAGARDLGRVLLEDRALGEERVVLLEAGDLVEEPGPLLVIEPLRPEGAGVAAQAATHVLDQAAAGPVGVQQHRDHRVGLCGHATLRAAPSSARRTPDSAHRAPGGTPLPQPARVWPGGVNAQPPRSTIWLDMNLPLYSPIAPAGGW